MGSSPQTSTMEGAMGQYCLIFILLALATKLSNSQVPCCGVKIVVGQGDLDDTYELIKEGSEKPEDVCADGCIYRRESNPVDEYCFIDRESSGSVVCQAIQTENPGDSFGTTVSLEDLEKQKAQIEEEERIAEEELEADLAEEATLSDAEAKVNKTEAFIDRLTSDTTESPQERKQRQAATSCAEIADLIDDMKEAVEQGDIVGMVTAAVRIMTSGITGCSATDRELIVQRKVKIQDCKGRVRERLVTIKIKIKIKRGKIKNIKKKKENILLAISKRPTRPPVKPQPIESTPVAFGSRPVKPSGTNLIESMPVPFGSKPTSKPFEESSPIAFVSKPMNENADETTSNIYNEVEGS